MSMKRQACYVAMLGVGGGAGMVLFTGSVQAAISYGLTLMTGAFIGLGMARR